jgi:aconitate hydratase
MIGTDSHTPMVNGIGVLGWGVGGLEAQTVMFGMPTMLRIPEVTACGLSAAGPGVLATDLALTVTQRLRASDVTGEFVEFFGPGVATLTAGDRAVVANMAPEYGATTGFFPVDATRCATCATPAAARPHVAWSRPTAAAPACGSTPRPRRATRARSRSTWPPSACTWPARAGRRTCWTTATPGAPAAVAASPRARPAALPRHPVALAAITSCTNTSDPRLLIAAGLVARKARALGLRCPAWVKTSLGPARRRRPSYLQRAGLLDDLEAVGFGIVGYGCTTCIGNPGR